MRTKGIGPQGLGLLGNNGYHIGSPAAFKEHKMYSKSGKEVNAETNQEHLDLKEDGYGHESPAKCWKGYSRVSGTKKGAKGSCKKSGAPVKIRKAAGRRKNAREAAEVEVKKTSKFMRKAGSRASGGGQDRNVTE